MSIIKLYLLKSQARMKFACIWSLLFLRNALGFGFAVPKLSRLTTTRIHNSNHLCDKIPQDLRTQIQRIAKDLWGNNIPVLGSPDHKNECLIKEGEAHFLNFDNNESTFSQRAEYFYEKALNGCPNAQHSYALLLWNGFGHENQDPKLSAKFHAAAAYQNHLDGMAVLGGCLRTGTGLQRNSVLGLELIEYCASQGNPTGVNKKAALLESNQDDCGAFQLYDACYHTGRVNALLLFNLGWCLVNGIGVKKKDVDTGIILWKKAAAMAPDEGSEEAAWYLFEEYKRDDPNEARKWLDLAEELGFDDAIELKRYDLPNSD